MPLTLLLKVAALLTAPVMVNWDFVTHDDLKRHEDLLDPRFAGKIVWDDPRLPGAGVGVGQRLLVNFGADFLQRLYAEQYLVQAFLAFNHAFRVRFPAMALSRAAPELLGQLIPGFSPAARPGALWFERTSTP